MPILDRENESKESSFDESKDKDYADWKRVRLAIEHENTLINHRLSWLFTSQAFLFTAFTIAFNAWKTPPPDIRSSSLSSLYLLGVIAFLGVSVCLLIWRGLTHAQIQLRRLDRWWYAENRDNLTIADLEKTYHRGDRSRSTPMQNKLSNHPPLQGESQSAWDNWINSTTIPVFFVVGWALIFMLTVLDMSSGIANMIRGHGIQLLSYVLVVIAALVLREYIARHRK